MDEFLALALHEERGLDCVIARLFNTVGARQSGQYGMVIPRMVERAVAGAPIEIHGDGTQTRCFCHVADAIRALQGLLEDGATSGEIFNVGSTESIRIRGRRALRRPPWPAVRSEPPARPDRSALKTRSPAPFRRRSTRSARRSPGPRLSRVRKGTTQPDSRGGSWARSGPARRNG